MHASSFSPLQPKAILVLWACLFISTPAHPGQSTASGAALQQIPSAVAASLEKNQIPKEAISISVIEIEQDRHGKMTAKPELDWRSTQAMNPASTMKLLTTLAGLDLLGPKYRWRTALFTDGLIRQGILKGNIYLQGTGDPKLIPEEFAKMMKALQNLGIQKIDGNLIFDRSAYAPSVMEHNTIDGESLRSYNVPPDPLLYAFRTLSFQLGKSRTADFIDINFSPPLSQLKVINQMQLVDRACENWKSNIRFNLETDSVAANQDQLLTAQFSGSFPNGCKDVNYNVVALDANTFLTQGFVAAWELSGGRWAQTPIGKSGTVPMSARSLLQFEGISLADDVHDINKYSNNVMARQLLLTLALEKIGKPATTQNGQLVIQAWLKESGLDFPELVIENGSGLSRNEAISAEHLTQLLVMARKLPTADLFYQSLPAAGVDGTMKNRLITQLRKFLHLKKKPEVRIKTGSLADVRAISGYVMTKSGKMYAVTSFINHPNAWRGLEAHDQLLAWLLEDGPEPKLAR
ncbi:D-alanyl-D-alanine carboxypeptidase/D-alanyl-D-alanine-endopeptidase [Polynucleobacter brandtiae]|uniref:D-alanyl-D-alanine carboxypeptidase/D-alanyl-D-alanine-endopeptidase (Penicillin-binding protein 4) n=1 Tax=Polynucleobacter brandtiae TaxID=1938816 RepID=A0A2M8VQ34_9BURK|nr:D-alanyl-D-alanine carboxypeptidase/D-alanyl-D-alanine-endopeptidase [Polynucleobacter brandtiae]PJI79272.1 D-alanyl-D-alanine carboxypeptidase/D-alanyl-D-alanine-endopeptidase (penicillin-binding protein 4) [Polynucleobacter brandtiae]